MAKYANRQTQRLVMVTSRMAKYANRPIQRFLIVNFSSRVAKYANQQTQRLVMVLVEWRSMPTDQLNGY